MRGVGGDNKASTKDWVGKQLSIEMLEEVKKPNLGKDTWHKGLSEIIFLDENAGDY